MNASRPYAPGHRVAPGRWSVWCAALRAIVASIGFAAAAAAAEQPPVGGRLLPVAAHEPKVLLVADGRGDAGWTATLVSLQGLLARRGDATQLYLSQPRSGHVVWPNELARRHDLLLVPAPPPEELLRTVGSVARGYVLFDPKAPESVNAATMLAAVEEGVLIDATHERIARAAGLVRLTDATHAGAVEVLTRVRDRLDATVLAEQNGARVWGLRDLLVMARMPVQYDVAFDSLTDGHDRAIFGWGNSVHGEHAFIARHSRLGLFTVPSDHATNLSVLSAFPAAQPLRQKPPVATAPVDARVHLVTFILTDGDNLGWVLGGFATDSRWFGSPSRGRFAMGFGLPPALVELAPDCLAWFYAQATRTAAASDAFVVGPSGGGYFYPSQYPRPALREHTDRLASWMARADLRLVQIIDDNALDRSELWTDYLSHEQIDGLIYLEYARYNKEAGRITWAAGKPVVAARHVLWRGLKGGDADAVVRALNAAPRDLSAPDSYSIVSVHAWSQSLADVEAVVRRLDPAVRVVAPDAFFATLRQHLRPDATVP